LTVPKFKETDGYILETTVTHWGGYDDPPDTDVVEVGTDIDPVNLIMDAVSQLFNDLLEDTYMYLNWKQDEEEKLEGEDDVW